VDARGTPSVGASLVVEMDFDLELRGKETTTRHTARTPAVKASRARQKQNQRRWSKGDPNGKGQQPCQRSSPAK
jgi:hypothetical protein